MEAKIEKKSGKTAITISSLLDRAEISNKDVKENRDKVRDCIIKALS